MSDIVIRMNKPEWMPDNPYSKDAKLASLEYYEGNAWHRGSTVTAKTILEHIRAWQGHPIDFRDKITQMLRQLEE
jgi:hypothetical protein